MVRLQPRRPFRQLLYVGSNVWRVTHGAATLLLGPVVVLELPLATLAVGPVNINYNWFPSWLSDLRCTQGARGTMYFAAHNNKCVADSHTPWPESTNRISQTDINKSPWTPSTRAAPVAAPCSNGDQLALRCVGGIIGAWVGGG